MIIVEEGFREHDAAFPHMNWPPQSPDLNPVENRWDEIEKTLGVLRLSRHPDKISAKT
jgi:hypothetical protein